MRSCWDRVREQTNGAGIEVLAKLRPEPARDDSSQVQDELGALATPAHAGPVEAHADDVADRPFWRRRPPSRLVAGYAAASSRS